MNPLREPTASRPLTSAEWCRAFRRNAEGLLELPWERGADLTPEELRSVGHSLRLFQLGESSEGRHFLGLVREHAERSGDPDYEEAAALFIAEEHRHARDLGRFLTLNGVRLLRRAWTDSVFRRLRRLAGLETSIAVLITAELIAQVYYAAIREATRSPLLRRLCDQILQDEARHVRFQAERLDVLRQEKPWWRNRLAVILHRAFLAVTCVIVWQDHGRAIRAGRLGFLAFVRASFGAFDTVADSLAGRPLEEAQSPRQVISLTPARWLIARARTNSRSPRRFR